MSRGGMRETFGSTCHGAGRALSIGPSPVGSSLLSVNYRVCAFRERSSGRNKSRNNLDYGDVLKRLEETGFSLTSLAVRISSAGHGHLDSSRLTKAHHGRGSRELLDSDQSLLSSFCVSAFSALRLQGRDAGGADLPRPRKAYLSAVFAPASARRRSQRSCRSRRRYLQEGYQAQAGCCR